MGGQTALNTAIALAGDGTLEKYGVQLIGADLDAINMAEDRLLFREAMDRIGLKAHARRLLIRWKKPLRGWKSWPADHHPSVFHAGRHGRRGRV